MLYLKKIFWIICEGKKFLVSLIPEQKYNIPLFVHFKNNIKWNVHNITHIFYALINLEARRVQTGK